MRNFKTIILSISVLFFSTLIYAEGLPDLNKSFENAKAYTKNNLLIVSTGAIERTWVWTGKGLSTTQLKNSSGEVVAVGSGEPSDWNIGEHGEGKLLSLKAFRDDDEHFTNEHLTVEMEIEYGNVILKYEIWAYPNAPGLRSQIWLKTPDGRNLEDGALNPGISEAIKIADKPDEVLALGYRAGLKADVDPYEILTTENIPEEGSSEITSGLIAAGGTGGLIVLKESQKHTDIYKGLETGGFERKENQLVVTGLGLRPDDLMDKEYKFCWANWLILYQGDEIDAQMEIKRFDRIRYPVHPERDVFIMANTWGSEDKSDQCCYKAREENVFTEIDLCAELGIDILQIDDGWQIREGENSWLPAAKGPTRSYKNGELPQLLDGTFMPESYDVYPDGFGKVREKANKKGISLGLWNAWTAPLNTLESNYDEGDFKSFKLDFAKLYEKEALDNLYYKARDLIKYSNYNAVVNWDVTESPARMGFYFGRDCGNLYLANRKAYTIRPSVLYEPWQVLRDGWELASYMNLNKVQLTFQNKDLTPPEALTDALEYTHAYNFAITLMSSPIFFTELQFLSPEARSELKPIIAKYKAERDEMYKGYVFAIGDKPDNKSWTGFQNYNPDSKTGYFTIFRELHNREKSKNIELKFIENKEIELYDLLTGEKRIITQFGSSLLFSLDKPASFQFYRYQILD